MKKIEKLTIVFIYVITTTVCFWDKTIEADSISGNPTFQYYSYYDEESEKTSRAVCAEGMSEIPLRFVAESFGMNVYWNSSTKTISIADKANNADIIVSIGSKQASVNGKNVNFNEPPVIYNDYPRFR